MGELVGKCDVKTMIEEKYGDNPHYVDPNIILIGEHMTIVKKKKKKNNKKKKK